MQIIQSLIDSFNHTPILDLKLFQSMTTAAAFFYNSSVSGMVKLIILISLISVASISLVIVDQTVLTIEYGTDKHDQSDDKGKAQSDSP